MAADATNRSLLVPALAGLVLFALLQVVFSITWNSLFAWAQVKKPWWLNSVGSIAVTLVVVFLATVVLLSRLGAPLARSALALLGGLLVGTVAALAVLRLGNLWPVALLPGCILLGGAVALGTVTVGAMLRLLRRRAA